MDPFVAWNVQPLAQLQTAFHTQEELGIRTVLNLPKIRFSRQDIMKRLK